MEFRVPAKSFREAFGVVGRAVPTRTPKPILQSVKAEATDGVLTLVATDHEIGVRHRVAEAEVVGGGACLLPRTQVDAILRSTAGESLAFRSDGTRLAISGGGARWTLATEDPAGFPEVAGFDAPDGHCLSLTAGDVKRMASRTTPATDPKGTRYALGGCLMEVSPDASWLVATDGRRLARQEVPASPGGNPPVTTGVLTTRFLDVLASSLGDDEAEVLLGFPDGRTAMAKSGGTELWGRLLEGRFPEWRQAMPPSSKHRVTIDAAVLRRAVERAATITSEETMALVFAFDHGTLAIGSTVADVGESDVRVEVEWPDGSPLSVAMGAPYVLGLLGPLGDCGAVEVGLVDAKSPVVFRTADGFEGLVMPMSVEGER